MRTFIMTFFLTSSKCILGNTRFWHLNTRTTISVCLLQHTRFIATDLTERNLAQTFVLCPTPTNPDSSERKTAVLFGWWGCSVRHFQKYIALYNELGFDVLAHAAPKSNLIRLEEYGRLNRQLSVELSEYWYSQLPTPVVFQVWSGNGASSFAGLCDNLKHSNSTGKAENGTKELWRFMQSCVMDSGPAVLNERVLSKAVLEALASPMYKEKGAIMEVMECAAEKVARSFFLLYLSLPHVRYHRDRIWKMTENVPTHLRYLFFFGKEDLVVQEKDVRAYMDLLRRKDVKGVEGKLFQSTGHVQHFRGHPNEYVKALKEFYSPLLSTTPQLDLDF